MKKGGLSSKRVHISDEPTKIGPIFPKSKLLKTRFQWLVLKLDKACFWYEILKRVDRVSVEILLQIFDIIASYWIDYLLAVILLY